MYNRTTFYITRALIGACEGGFIPGTILFATYFYKSRELSVRLAVFWSTLNVRSPPNISELVIDVCLGCKSYLKSSCCSHPPDAWC
jgi:hypothetical protein